MRICLDLSPAVHRRAGLGRYAGELMGALLEQGAGHEYVAFYNRPNMVQVGAPFEQVAQLTIPLADKPWRLRVLLAHFLRLSQDRLFPGVDLFHATDNLLPRLGRVKSVLALHDFAFRLYPETHTLLNRWFLTLMMPRFLSAADRVLAASECTKWDAVRLYGLDEARIRVVPYGVSSRFHPINPEIVASVRARYELPERCLLFVGSIEPRKNLLILLEALVALRAQMVGRQLRADWKLVIVGKKGWLYESFFRRLRELGLERDVMLLNFVPDEDLPAIYCAADLFVFPSWYEGFGLPVLEAMACGVPVVCSNVASLPEVAGEAAMLVDPRDVRGLTEALLRVLTDEELRREKVERGLHRAAQFTWCKTAKQTLAVYHAVAAERGIEQ